MSKRRLVLNSLTRVGLLLCGIIAALVMSPIIVHGLGNREYGVWELLGTLVGYLGLLELGIGSAMVRFVADAWSREDRGALEQIFNTSLVALLGLGLLGLLVCVAISTHSEQLLVLGASDRIQEYSLVLILLGLNLAARLPGGAAIAYSFGLQAHRFIDTLRIIILVLTNVAIYGVFDAAWDRPMVWMALVMLVGTLAETALVTFWIIVVDRRIRINLSSLKLTIFVSLLGFGAKNVGAAASEMMMRRLVNFAIAYTSGVAQVVYFVIANRLVEYGQSVAMALVSPMTPYFADMAGKSEQSALRQSWLQITRVCQAVTFGIWMAVAAFGEPFIRLWMGDEYADRGGGAFYILCIGLFVQSIASNSNQLLQSLNRHGRVAIAMGILAPIFFGASVALGWKWGLEGIAAAVSGYSAAIALTDATLAARNVGATLLNYVASTAARFSIPIAVTGGVLFCQRQISYPVSYGELFVYSLLPSLTYLIAVWMIVFDRQEKEIIWHFVARHKHNAVASGSGQQNS